MNNWMKVTVMALLAVAIGAVVIAKRSPTSAADEARAGAATTPPVSAAATPRLLDLGATQCIPCKMMAPILDELKKEYAGKMQVDFIDVWKNPAAGEQYGIEGIPTQIFFDATGKELYRHQGFMPKEDILAKCKELGFALP